MMAVFNAEWGRPCPWMIWRKTSRPSTPPVLSSEKRVVPGFIIALCGAPTGIANVYEIAKDDLPRIPADPQGVKRFQAWVYEGPSLEVAKYDGSLQCEMGQPVSLDHMEKELRAANIAVESRAKKADGIQHPRMCGASTGTMNVYRIKYVRLGEGSSIGLCSVCRRDLDRERSKRESRGDATLKRAALCRPHRSHGEDDALISW